MSFPSDPLDAGHDPVHEEYDSADDFEPPKKVKAKVGRALITSEERRKDLRVAAKNKTAEVKLRIVRAVNLTVGDPNDPNENLQQPHYAVGTVILSKIKCVAFMIANPSIPCLTLCSIKILLNLGEN